MDVLGAIDEKTHKKLFGNISIRDMVAAQDRTIAADSDFGAAYTINSEARFNFSNKQIGLPK